jgi:transcriptional regulator with XRE-family HTH domain
VVGLEVLCAIESGRHRPDAATIGRLLDAYGCSIDDAVPPRRPFSADRFEGMAEADVLKHYLALVHKWRRSERPQRFRAEDLSVLVGIPAPTGRPSRPSSVP